MNVTWNAIILYVLMWLAKTKIQGIVALNEDLVDEYYTTVLKPNDNFLPKDETDAQAIMDNDRNEVVIAGILPYRDKIRRFAIQQRMLTKIKAFVEYDTTYFPNTYYYWPSKKYRPQRCSNSTDTFMDLCFGLLEDENVVLGQYLNNFFETQEETWIIIAMVLIKDMGGMIRTYDENQGEYMFEIQRKSQRHPFENMLRVWVRQNHDPIESAEPNSDNVKKDANILKAEYDSGSWHQKNRDQLELILMKKSFKYARAVIAEFETAMGGKKLEDIINDCIHSDIKLNHDLADAYASLARYIKDKYTYIAGILRMYSDGSDLWAAWVMCIAVLHPQEWPNVDQAFQKDHIRDSLSQFILQRLVTDKVMAEMIAAIVDPQFEPTTFVGKPDSEESCIISTLPPVPFTVVTPMLPPSPL